ncbi:hypothetical protein JW979_10995 [bacterium]|nr:hypothetical protein [candidate division CSSED10-310 bacterium]
MMNKHPGYPVRSVPVIQILSVLGMIAAAVNAMAASPPDVMDFQAIVQTTAGEPLTDGFYDAVFTFFDTETATDTILIEEHSAELGNPVTVTDGLCNLILGTGTILDGSGEGEYTSLADMFKDFDELWLQITFDGELFPGRCEILPVMSVINADTLDGLDSSQFSDGHSLDAPDGDPSDALYVNDSGDVGIGTTAPSRRLHVRTQTTGGIIIDTSETNNCNLKFSKDRSSSWALSVNPGNAFRIREDASSTDMIILPGGNVGIGVSNPVCRLEIGGDAGIEGRLVDSNGSPGTSGSIMTSSGTGTQWLDSAMLSDMDWTVTGTSLVAQNSGNTGIGTDVPEGKLTVAGPVSDVPGNGSQFRIEDASNSNHAFAFRIGNSGHNDLHLDSYWGGWQRLLTIDRSNGFTGIGADPLNTLDISGKAVIGSALAGTTSGTPQGLLVQGNVGIGLTDPDPEYRLFVDGTVRLDGDRQLSFSDTGSSNIKLQLTDTCGMGVDGVTLFSSNAGSFSWEGSDGYESMVYDGGSGGSLIVSGASNYYAGNLGVGTLTPLNRLDISGRGVIGAGFCGVETPPFNGLIIEGKFGIGEAYYTDLSIEDGDLLGENTNGDDKYVAGIDSGGGGYIYTYGDPSTTNIIMSHDSDHVNYGSIRVFDDEGTCKAEFFADTSGAGFLKTYGQNNNRNAIVKHSGMPENGYIGVVDGNNDILAGMMAMPGNLGHVFADYKFYNKKNPRDPNTDIVYACLEGPEAAAYLRGTSSLSNGSACVMFPDHFRLVINPDNMTIQITPLSLESQGLAVTDKHGNGFCVRELNHGAGSYDFDWEVKCVRKGFENYQAVRRKLIFERFSNGEDQP